MALSTTITKKPCTIRGVDSYYAILNLVYADGETILIDRDFYQSYKKGQAWATLTVPFREEMRAAIAAYKAWKLVNEAAGLTGVIDNLNATVGV